MSQKFGVTSLGKGLPHRAREADQCSSSLGHLRLILEGFWAQNDERKKHIYSFTRKFFVRRPLTPVCPKGKLGLSLGQTGLPQRKIRRKPGLSLGQTGPVLGTNPRSSQGQPDQKAYLYALLQFNVLPNRGLYEITETPGFEFT